MIRPTTSFSKPTDVAHVLVHGRMFWLWVHSKYHLPGTVLWCDPQPVLGKIVKHGRYYRIPYKATFE